MHDFKIGPWREDEGIFGIRTNPDAICCISWDWDIVSCRTQIFCFYDIFRCGYDFGGGVSKSLSEAF